MDRETALALLTLAELPRVGERRVARVCERARGGADIAAEVLDAAARRAGARLSVCRPRPWPGWRGRSCGTRRTAARCWRGWRRAARGSASAGRAPTIPAAWLSAAIQPPPLAYRYGAAQLLAAPRVALLRSRGLTEQVVTATVHVVRRAAADGCALAVGGMKSTHRIAAVGARAAGARAAGGARPRPLRRLRRAGPSSTRSASRPAARASIRAPRWCCRSFAPTTTPRRATAAAATS